MPRFSFVSLFLVMALSLVANASGEEKRGLNGLPEKPLEQLSDKRFSTLANQALAIRPKDWKHGETDNFVYHFFQGYLATSVSIEAEFYYRVIAKELNRDTTQWQQKGHIFIFDEPADWSAFATKAALDPWTGGIHSGAELFIQRRPGADWSNRTLGHEVAHLVIHRFFGNGIPLWLNEGYAEYASIRGFASYYRARNYIAKPQSHSVSPESFIPLAELTNAVSYPAEEPKVVTFYIESEKLVRFLCKTDKQAFATFMEAMSKGSRFDTALSRAYGMRFYGVSGLEQDFKKYATKDADSPTLQDD